MSFRTPEPESPGRPRSPPGAPRFGPIFDDCDVYAPRKSARVAQKQRADSTPSAPKKLESAKKQPDSDDVFGLASTPTNGKTTNHSMATDFASPPDTVKTGSRKKDVGAVEKNKEDTVMTGMGSTAISGMLPTPAKTPSSKTTIEDGAIRSVARNLFNSRAVTVEDAMPTPRKKKGKFVFSSEEEEKPIEIYTDTKERIPEVDDSQDNPFYSKEKTSTPKPAATSTKRRKTGRGAKVAQHAYGPESMGSDGALYTFRGKKFWRSFEKKEESSDELMDEVDGLESPRLSVPLSKSTEPRWLFGPNPKKAREEEEAETDVEESTRQKADLKHKPANFAASKLPINASKPKIAPAKKNPAKTSTAPKIPALNIPATTRVTRAQKLAHGHTSNGGEASDGGRGRTRGAAKSPFDHWSRTRSPMDAVSDLGSPTRKPELRARAMRARSARTA